MVQIIVLMRNETDGHGWFVRLQGLMPENRGGSMDSATTWNRVQDAKEHAESIFGLLDWGKGGQHENEARVAID
jgi:hypothetical protein